MASMYYADSTKWISIAGNIGSGKSTLSEIIGRELIGHVDGVDIPYHLLQEEWKTNPYFDRYYEAISRFYEELGNGSYALGKGGYANGNGAGQLPDPVFFNAQYWWLTKKGNQNSEIPSLLKKVNVSQDRSIYEDALFAKNFIRLGLISEENAQVYLQTYKGLSYYREPDMLYYLRTHSTVCMERICKRGRPAEQKIPLRYLESLEEMYEVWWQDSTHPKKRAIDTDGLNLVDSRNDIQYVLDIIRIGLARA